MRLLPITARISDTQSWAPSVDDTEVASVMEILALRNAGLGALHNIRAIYLERETL